VTAFKGRDPTRSKIAINNKITEQVNIFNYLGNFVSYEKEKNIWTTKLQIFKDNRTNQEHIQTKKKSKTYTNKIVYYIGSSSITIWQRNMYSTIKRQIQTDSIGNEVYTKDWKICMEVSQNQ
jgi:hypothetical protein